VSFDYLYFSATGGVKGDWACCELMPAGRAGAGGLVTGAEMTLDRIPRERSKIHVTGRPVPPAAVSPPLAFPPPSGQTGQVVAPENGRGC
jgi:hypothetical protein